MTMEKRGVTADDAKAASQKQANQKQQGSPRLDPANESTIGNDMMSRITKRAVDSLVRKKQK